KDEIGKLFDKHGGELYLSDILSGLRSHAPAPKFSLHEEGGTLAIKGSRFDISVPVLQEDRTGRRYVYAQIPAEALTGDANVNPRHLQRPRLEKLVEAFRSGQTRFQATLARFLPGLKDAADYEIAVFDGSHGGAAEILADSKHIACKIFLPGE